MGTLQGVPSPTGEGELSTSNIGIGAPGMNMVLNDCTFEGVTSDQLFYLHRDMLTAPEDFPPLSADATIKNSVFRNSTYSFDVINTREQTIKVDNVVFEDLKYEPCTCTNISAVIRITEGGYVDLEDCVFGDVEYLSSVVITFGNDSIFTYLNISASGLTVYDKEKNRNETDYCELGLIVETVENGMFDSCESIFSGNESPTNVPSAAPIEKSSAVATSGDPSVSPTGSLSAVPTGGSSAAPTTTDSSADPTGGPSAAPINDLSAAPSDDPSAAPASSGLTTAILSGIVAVGYYMMVMA
jgi:hypothetical protein